MQECWAAKPDKRPTFKDLVNQIGGLLSSRAGYLDLHINKALTAVEELCATEYSYIDPDRMFHLIQSLRISGEKHNSATNQAPIEKSKTPQSGAKTYVYTGLLTSPQDPVSTSTYTSLQPKARTATSKPTASISPPMKHKRADTNYTQLIASTVQEEGGYTSMANADRLHYGTKPPTCMKHKMGCKAELMASSPRSDNDTELVESGSSYVNSIYDMA